VRLFVDTAPLQTNEFRRLWLAGIPFVIGANLTTFAVPVQIYALTQNSAYVGLAGIFALVPLIVFGLLGGAWADAMDRRILLIIATCGMVAASFLLWLQAALSVDDVWVVLSLLAVQQAFYAVSVPTRSAAIPRMLPGHRLLAANSLDMLVRRFGAVIGPLLAGLLLNWVDLSTLYLIDVLTCLVPIWATFRLAPMPFVESAAIAGRSARWGLGAVLEGFRYLLRTTVVLMSLVLDLIAMILGRPLALFPQIAHQSFGGPIEGGTQVALLAAAMAAGAAAGGVFSGWLPHIRRQGLAVVIATAAWGAAMVGFGLICGQANGRTGPYLWGALAFLAFGGLAEMVSSSFCLTILQQAASAELRGRLQGVSIVVGNGGPRLGDALHGAAAAIIGTSTTAAGGGALVLFGVLTAALAAPAFLRYQPTTGAEEEPGPEPT
jgi:hypothetical protein